MRVIDLERSDGLVFNRLLHHFGGRIDVNVVPEGQSVGWWTTVPARQHMNLCCPTVSVPNPRMFRDRNLHRRTALVRKGTCHTLLVTDFLLNSTIILSMLPYFIQNSGPARAASPEARPEGQLERLHKVDCLQENDLPVIDRDRHGIKRGPLDGL